MPDFPAEIEDEFQELLFALENSERGGWFFAVYQQWKVAEELIQRLHDSTQLPIFNWQYSQETPSYPIDYLKNISPEQKTQRAIVLFSHVASGGEKVIKSLDFNRERFSDYPHSLLFWVTESELKQIAIGAGHFWAQRGGRFDFSKVLIPETENTAHYQSSEWAGLLLHVENYREAEQQLAFYLAELEQRKNEVETLALAEVYDKVAYLLYFLGKYSEATPYAEKVLAIRKQILGEEHLQVAASLNNLGELYYYQGLYDKALLLVEDSLAIRKKQLGDNHPDVAQSLNNLAELYQDQGRTAEALPLHQRALAIFEKVLGEQHPTVASSLDNLAGLYEDQGRTAEALPLVQRALVIRENFLGEQHPHVASSLNNLAVLYDDQGRTAEALPLFQRALAIREKVLGEQHPDVANSLNNLAAFYDNQGRTAEALPLVQRALAIFENSLGTEHPRTKTVAENYIFLQAKMAKS